MKITDMHLKFNQENLAIFDIETTGLKATFGYMISYAIKFINKCGQAGKFIEDKTICRSISRKDILSRRLDKNLIEQLIKDLAGVDRVISFFGSRFDIKFIRTRAVYHGIDFPTYGEIRHTDIYYMLRNRFLLHSNRLGNACDFFGIKAKGHPMKPDQWAGAMAGDKKDIDYIKTHNLEDVESTYKLFKLVLPYSQWNKRSM